MYAIPLLLAAGRAPADIGLSLIGVLFFIHCLVTRQWRWLRQTDMQILAALWIYIVAATLFSPIDGALKAALFWGRFPLFYAAMRFWLLNDRERCTRLAYCTLAVVALVTIDSLWQYATGTSLTGRPMRGDRLSGSLSSANVGNLLIKLTLPAAGWLLCTTQDPRVRKAALGIACAAAVLVPLTGERTTTLLMLIGFAAAALVLWLRYPPIRKNVMKAALVLVLAAVAVSFQDVVQHRAVKLAQDIQNFPQSPYGLLFTAAWKMWLQSPVFGAGLLGFREASLHIPPFRDDVHAHNIYLHWLAETGIIGAGLFVLFAGWCVWRWWQFTRGARGMEGMEAAAVAATLVVLLFPITVTQNLFSNWPGVLFWFTLAFCMAILSVLRKPA